MFFLLAVILFFVAWFLMDYRLSRKGLVGKLVEHYRTKLVIADIPKFRYQSIELGYLSTLPSTTETEYMGWLIIKPTEHGLYISSSSFWPTVFPIKLLIPWSDIADSGIKKGWLKKRHRLDVTSRGYFLIVDNTVFIESQRFL